MGYTVVPEGDMTDSTYREYVRQLVRVLLKRGVALERVPRTPVNGNGERWLYVWDSEQEARDFAKQLADGSDEAEWSVRPVDGPVSRGPLRPLEVEVGREVSAWTFGLGPQTRKALQLRLPGSCQNDDVSIGMPFEAGRRPEWTTTVEGVRALLAHVLPLLTGMGSEQLRVFGSYEVVDSLTREIVVPPTAFQPEETVPSPPVPETSGAV